MRHFEGQHHPDAQVGEPEDLPRLLLQGPRILLAISILREDWRQLRQGRDYLPISGKSGKYLGVKKEAGVKMSKCLFRSSQNEAPQKYPASVPETFAGPVGFIFCLEMAFIKKNVLERN